jgi:hypothetical protein
VLKGNELEVHGLDEWPEHPVLGESVPVGWLNLLLRVWAFHDSHRGQEGEQVEGSKNSLIETDTSKDLSVGRARNANTALEEAEPGGSERTEDSCIDSVSVVIEIKHQWIHTSTVECHASTAGKIVVLQANLLDTLLSHGITSSEEDLASLLTTEHSRRRSFVTYSSGDTLSEHGTLSKLHAIPECMSAIERSRPNW